MSQWWWKWNINVCLLLFFWIWCNLFFLYLIYSQTFKFFLFIISFVLFFSLKFYIDNLTKGLNECLAQIISGILQRWNSLLIIDLCKCFFSSVLFCMLVWLVDCVKVFCCFLRHAQSRFVFDKNVRFTKHQWLVFTINNCSCLS